MKYRRKHAGAFALVETKTNQGNKIVAKGKPHREQEELHQSGISDDDVRIGDFNFSRLGSTEIDILTVIRVKDKHQKYNLYVNKKLKHRLVGPDVVIATLCRNMQSMSEMVSIYETMKF